MINKFFFEKNHSLTIYTMWKSQKMLINYIDSKTIGFWLTKINKQKYVNLFECSDFVVEDKYFKQPIYTILSLNGYMYLTFKQEENDTAGYFLIDKALKLKTLSIIEIPCRKGYL